MYNLVGSSDGVVLISDYLFEQQTQSALAWQGGCVIRFSARNSVRNCHVAVLSSASCVNSVGLPPPIQLLHETPPTGTGPATALDGLPGFCPIPWDRNRAFLIQTVYMWRQTEREPKLREK